jgi:hypothetical protein
MPAARGRLGRIGAQTFGVQPLNRPFHQRREILATAGQRHRLNEEANGIRAHHAVNQRAGIGRRRKLFSRMLFGSACHVKHVTTRGFDEQRLLLVNEGAEGEGTGCRGEAVSVVPRCSVYLRPDGPQGAVHRGRIGSRRHRLPVRRSSAELTRNVLSVAPDGTDERTPALNGKATRMTPSGTTSKAASAPRKADLE